MEGGSLCSRQIVTFYMGIDERKTIHFKPFCVTSPLKLILVSSWPQKKGSTCLYLLLTHLLGKQILLYSSIPLEPLRCSCTGMCRGAFHLNGCFTSTLLWNQRNTENSGNTDWKSEYSRPTDKKQHHEN